MTDEQTTVVVVGGGPVGLILAHRLHTAGVPVVVLDNREATLADQADYGRAGLWEQRTVTTLTKYELADGLLAQGTRHPAFELRCFGESRMVEYGKWAGGDVASYAYPQLSLERDLRAAFSAVNGDLRSGATVFDVTGLDEDDVRVHYRLTDGTTRALRCGAVIAADGSQGKCQEFAPWGAFTRHHSTYPVGGVAVFAESPPPSHGTVYAASEHGFAAHAIRTPTVSRFYIQCPPTDSVDYWPDERVWAELDRNLAVVDGPRPPAPHGRILHTAIVYMRTHITEPMQYKAMYLVGDAGHAITPMGAKGANLGVADVADLAESLIAHYLHGDEDGLRDYSRRRLADVWQGQAFSRLLLDLFSPPPTEDIVALRIRRSRIEEIVEGGPFSEWFSRRYAGLDG
jgi:p-hydroxybenzoate 3-monooxygenase